jgi:hypothetical protein
MSLACSDLQLLAPSDRASAALCNCDAPTATCRHVLLGQHPDNGLSSIASNVIAVIAAVGNSLKPQVNLQR